MIISKWLPEAQKLPSPYPEPVSGWKHGIRWQHKKSRLNLYLSLRWNHFLVYYIATNLWVLGCQSWGVRTLRSTVWPRRHTETFFNLENKNTLNYIFWSDSGFNSTDNWCLWSHLLLCNDGEGIGVVSATVVCWVERDLEHLAILILEYCIWSSANAPDISRERSGAPCKAGQG